MSGRLTSFVVLADNLWIVRERLTALGQLVAAEGLDHHVHQFSVLGEGGEQAGGKVRVVVTVEPLDRLGDPDE